MKYSYPAVELVHMQPGHAVQDRGAGSPAGEPAFMRACPRALTLAFCVYALIGSQALSARVKTGLDVLVDQDFAPIAGKRVGVIANNNSRTWDHRNIVALLAASPKVKLTAIFLKNRK